jgi:hypothetical protein
MIRLRRTHPRPGPNPDPTRHVTELGRVGRPDPTRGVVGPRVGLAQPNLISLIC